MMGVGWLVVMNALQPRIMQGAVGIHPIVVLGSVLIGSKIAGIPGAIFGIPVAAVVSAFFFHFLHRPRATGPSPAARPSASASARGGRSGSPASRHPDRPPTSPSRERRARPRRPPRDGDDPAGASRGEVPDMTRERARTERRDLDKERGEPLAGGSARGGPRALRTPGRPVPEWTSRPRILVTNDDGVESRGLLALKQALEPMGEVTVVAPGHQPERGRPQKTLMRPLRVRERTLADGSTAYSVDGSPTDAVSLAFLGYFGHGFDLVASGINYGANLGDDITYSGTSARRWRRSSTAARPSRSRRSTTSTPTSRWPATRRRSSPATSSSGLSRGELINVNVPAVSLEECEGIEVTRLGRRVYSDELVERLDPRGIPLLLDRRPAASGSRSRAPTSMRWSTSASRSRRSTST